MRPRGHRTALAALLALVASCGPAIPPRFVVERDLGDYLYRRYQRVLDIEIRVEGNPAVGHTASYVRRRGSRLYVATAFVTVYEHAASLAAEVRDTLMGMGSYEVHTAKHSGEWVWEVDGGDDQWWMWVSENHVVKIGAPRGREMPDDVADEYLDIYPSDLEESGRARESAESAGPSRAQQEEEGELDLPLHLRENTN